MDDEHKVIISAQYLKELERDSRILGALYNGGVQDWDWYDESLASLEGDE